VIKLVHDPWRANTEISVFPHWVVFSRIVPFTRLGLCIVHCLWGIQAGNEPQDFLNYITSFEQDFDATNRLLLREKVAVMIQNFPSDNYFFRNWKKVEVFTWRTRFPGEGKRLRIKLFPTEESRELRAALDEFKQLATRSRRLLTQAQIDWLVNAVRDPDPEAPPFG
jgi:hypothetical protein